MTNAFPYYNTGISNTKKLIVYSAGEYSTKVQGLDKLAYYHKTPLAVIEYPVGREDLAQKEAEHQYLDESGKDVSKHRLLMYKDYWEATYQDRTDAMTTRFIGIEIKSDESKKDDQDDLKV